MGQGSGEAEIMSKPKWRSGPPPSKGWWIASLTRNAAYLRWWDGANWSSFAKEHYSAREAAKSAKVKVPARRVAATSSVVSFDGAGIEWLPRPTNWPARSKPV